MQTRTLRVQLKRNHLRLWVVTDGVKEKIGQRVTVDAKCAVCLSAIDKEASRVTLRHGLHRKLRCTLFLGVGVLVRLGANGRRTSARRQRCGHI